ncbi:MAG: TAXI family TRAP transporter solute-binding subunit [Promethearchaeota archaeon]
MKRYLFLDLSVVFLIIGVAYSETRDILTLATGSEKGVYYALGQDIAEVAKKSGLKINVLSSQGSQENLFWLLEDKAQLCLAQSDTVYNAYNGFDQFKEKITNIQAIASLYTEAVHILVRNPLYIRNIENFKGKRISIGPEGSGTESNALAILEAVGITSNEIQLLHLSFEDSIKAISENKVDIVFFTSGYPSDVVKIIMQNKSAYFFEPNPKILRRLIDTQPFFVVTTIPPGTYTNQNEEITTIGVSALLVGRNDLDNHLIYTITKLIFSDNTLIINYHKKGLDITLDSVFKGITIPVNNGAVQFYNEKGIYRKELYRKIIINYVLPALMVLFLFIAVINLKKIKFFFKKREIARVLVALTLIWALGSITLYFSEHKINENYDNLPLAFWSGLINWINFGAREPFTYTGRITAITMVIIGVGGITWFTGTLASIFIHKKLMGGKRMIEKLKNHYVIINWNDKGHGIIKQLQNPDLERKPILVVTDQKESPISLEYEYEDVLHIGGSINEALLKKAKVHYAYSVTVLANDLNNPDASDAKTILIILAIRKICETENKQVPIVAEILEPQKVELAEYAGVLGDSNVEVVSSKYIIHNFLAQVAANPGLTKIYNDLLTFGKYTNEIYSCKIPSKFIGKKVSEFFKYVIALKNKNVDIIPIAISRREKTYINPSNSDINCVENGDTLFAICDNENVLKKLKC